MSSILNIIDVGASIGHLGPQNSQLCNNLRSALDHSAIISKKIDSLLSGGHIHGPFSELSLPNFCCSPLGTSTHRHNPKCCIFNHYSWPNGHSIKMECMMRKGPSNMTLSPQQWLHCESLEEDPCSPNWTSTGTSQSTTQIGT